MFEADLDDLRQQVRDLADRVTRLESSPAKSPSLAASPLLDVAAPPPTLAESVALPFPLPEATPILPLLGIATLGMAGAYLLRAIAESGTLPPRVGVAVGTLYAVGWLLWASREHAGARFTTMLYSLTSALILSPLLWEATARFHTVSAGQASVILVAFTVIGLAVSWQRNLLIVATIATLAGIGTAGALLIATDDVLPFTLVFLSIAAAIEICACLNHWLGERWFTALVADLAVLFATWLVTNSRGLPAGYAPIPAGALLAAQLALLVIYLSSVMVRTLVHRRTFSNFETAQCALAFVIGLGGAISVSAEGSSRAPAVAIFALLCGAACYAISFRVLARRDSGGRNFYTYSTFAILLVLVGCRILLSGGVAAIAWSFLALACIGAGGYWSRVTLEVHGAVYLLVALLISGALRDASHFVLGADLWPGELHAPLWAGALMAGAAYLVASRSTRHRGGVDKLNPLRVAMAAVLVWMVLGLTASSLTGVYHALFGTPSGHPYCATLRTAGVVIVALLLAVLGARPELRSFAPLVYPLMALGAYRLFSDDLHQDRKAALFLSLLFYGGGLILLPRLRRPRPPAVSC